MSTGDINNAGTHCWHATSISLTTDPPQKLEVCCWCGGQRTEINARVPKTGHGRFIPAEDAYTHDTVYSGGENPCWGHLSGTLRSNRWPQ